MHNNGEGQPEAAILWMQWLCDACVCKCMHRLHAILYKHGMRRRHLLFYISALEGACLHGKTHIFGCDESTLVVGVIQQITLLLHSALSAWLPLLSPSVCSSDLVSLPSVGTSKQQPNSQFKHASKMFLHFLNRATHAPSPSPPLSHPPP